MSTFGLCMVGTSVKQNVKTALNIQSGSSCPQPLQSSHIAINRTGKQSKLTRTVRIFWVSGWGRVEVKQDFVSRTNLPLFIWLLNLTQLSDFVHHINTDLLLFKYNFLKVSFNIKLINCFKCKFNLS